MVVLAILWAVAARYQNNDLLLPSFLRTFHVFYEGIVGGELLGYAAINKNDCPLAATSSIMAPEPDVAPASGMAGKRIYDDAVFCLGGGIGFVDIGFC
ncbi:MULTISPECIES: hypothetical protein [unclassified Pseudomonas]|uniref:hypothetical protein n=1 Tax=Pseudomonas imrae TaxID=2992837 RepID=UPI003965CBBB